MRAVSLFLGLLLLANLEGASPYEGGPRPDPAGKINVILREGWKKADLAPPETASDAVFLRRVYLTVAGRIPGIAEARRFLRDKAKDKRERLIDALLDSDGYGDLLAMRFADMLRIKSEFPINLWPNGVQAWHRQIRAELLADRSYRDMARDMLTASGSNFRVPHANFFRASADRSPLGLGKAVALTFLCIRLENLPEDDQEAFAEFFSRIRYKSTYEWKEEIVYTDYHPARVKARALDGETFTIDAPDTDPRRVFADWLLREDNPYFARAAVNRVWHWIFGRGIMPDTDNLALLPTFWDRVRNVFGRGEQSPLQSGASRLPGERVPLLQLQFQASLPHDSQFRSLPGECDELRPEGRGAFRLVSGPPPGLRNPDRRAGRRKRRL